MTRKEETLRETIKRVYDEIVNYPNEFACESDRGAAVLAAAIFEESLLRAIMTKVVRVDKGIVKHLTNRLLYSFTDKIIVAFLLGLYDQKTLSGLKTVSKIRNLFAHNAKVKDFRSKEVADLCRKLDTRTILDPIELKERYLHFLREVESDIQNKLTHAEVFKRMG